jgi:hypothetical protein
MKKLLNKFFIETATGKDLERLSIESAMNHGTPEKFMFVGEKGCRAFAKFMKLLRKGKK